MNIGFIGLGLMGKWMAKNILNEGFFDKLKQWKDALPSYKEISQKMYDDVLSSQYGVDGKNNFSISPESIQLKPELKARMKTKDELPEPVLHTHTADDLQALEDMVDMHTESHRL